MWNQARYLADFARFVTTKGTQEGHDLQALAELEARGLELPAGLELEWLGVSGYRIGYEGCDLLIDPYVSRVPLSSILARRPALPDPALIERYIGSPARPVGFTPSLHSKLLLGLAVPMGGEFSCDHLDGLTTGAYRCGQVYGIRIEVAGISFYHQGSANLIDDEIREPVDVFLAGVAGRGFTRDYWRRVLRTLAPRTVVPTHYDDFFRPLDATMGLTTNVNLAHVPDEIAAVSRDIQVSALPVLSGHSR
jgi:L-ascorbate metabolism protein UlaG (beta-lactamase superfamily)